MRVSPCGWAVDLARFTYRYRVYPVADDPNLTTFIRTYFTSAPFISIPHVFGNPTFDVDNEADELPCVGHAWTDHSIKRGPPMALLGHCARWAGTDAQWRGEIYSTQPPLPVGPSGLPLACECWQPYQPTLYFPWRRPSPPLRQRPPQRTPSGTLRYPFEDFPPVLKPAPIALLRAAVPRSRPADTSLGRWLRSMPILPPAPLGWPPEVLVELPGVTDNNCDCQPFRDGVLLSLSVDDPELPVWELVDPLGGGGCAGVMQLNGTVSTGTWILSFSGPMIWTATGVSWNGTVPLPLTSTGPADQFQCENYPLSITVIGVW